MRDSDWWTVFRRSVTQDGLSVEREFVWAVDSEEGLPVRRTVIDAYSGEILDEMSLTQSGEVRSHSTHPRRGGRSSAPDGDEAALVEAVVATPTRSNSDVIEDGGDDRMLPREGQVGPALAQGGSVADVPLKDRDAA